ncbi:WGR domain-containing protein [Defluviimonas salinarum]|uniref:WGR domain-containing protein n=1 Tax=Defluviimonas salinarum TaxID=2992147 RepID=A0ABT3J790_9RHOB|nr:WGR domain-containing protein [Defluviimonas salinarum]MCW3783558.1 WGR domain-containing protein [Defluviimonas salinarum]
MDIYLEKVDPEANCFRFYNIRSEPDLFAERALVVQWGRIGRAGQVRIRGSGSIEEVGRIGAKILKLRLSHGYSEPGQDQGEGAPAASSGADSGPSA